MSAPLILLAEDNEMTITLVSAYLQQQGYQVMVVRNGEEALDTAREYHPDLVLMDIQMPRMDGLEATRHMRARPELASIPVVALTALALPGDRERCLEAGANEYVSKPVSLKQLRYVLETLLEQHVPQNNTATLHRYQHNHI
jgi:CheY-like chemotaxis protein